MNKDVITTRSIYKLDRWGANCSDSKRKKTMANLKREEITDEELLAAIREHGVIKIEAIQRAFLETDGNISVVSYDHDKRPT